jgi:hypothetical protein
MPTPPLKNPAAIQARLMDRSVADGECRVFTGSKHVFGYGKMWDGERADVTHRLAYRAFVGPIPDGMAVCHRCDNPPCIRVEHLFLGTLADNLADMRAKRRHSQGPRHSELLRAVWTDERRAKQRAGVKARTKIRREEAARAAGVPTDWKCCSGCREWKPMTEFHRSTGKYDGFKERCKPCRSTKTAR